VGQFEFVLKGHGFSRAVTTAKSVAALAAAGLCRSTYSWERLTVGMTGTTLVIALHAIT
jgi:hypothetical protein